MAKKNMGSGVVFSTEHGKMCPACERAVAECCCRTTPLAVNADGVVMVSRETKGRKGKGVTLVRGVALDASSLKKLAKELKQKCGSGGTVKQGVIEIQGDHLDLMVAELQGKGFLVKRSGG